MIVRAAEASDMPAYFDHMKRHFRESGAGGDILFHPVEDFEQWDRAEQIARSIAELEAPLTDLAWTRYWICELGGEVVADALIRSARAPSSQHRCVFAIGIERGARGQGLGRRLSMQAISWARMQPTLEYLDLFVFAHNAPAIALYKSLGFATLHTVEDQFRVRGQPIADTQMCLRLKP